MRESELADALTAAHWPSLVPVLARLTGDTVRFAPLLPAKVDMLDPDGGMTADQRAAAHQEALTVLGALLRGELDPPPVDAALARDLVALLLGPDTDRYAELSAEEVGLPEADPRKPRWHKENLAPGVPVNVVVIGAGMSGLLAAHRLAQAGIEYLVLEKNTDLGGTWWENTYPGCRVDVPSHLYTYSAGARQDWADHFATQPDILSGFRRFAEETGVNLRIRFGTEVTALRWDGARWHLDTSTGPVTATAVITAVGQLNRPLIPDIPGRDTFTGPAFHTAAWDHTADLTGKRVAVVGTGSSAVQVIPRVAEAAGHTTVFGRTPPWLIPTPHFAAPVDPRLRALFAAVPGYQRWYRFWLLRSVSDALLPFATVDPEWTEPGSVSKANDRMRRASLAYLHEQFADRPDLLARVVPDYPVFAKRAIRDDGSWARTLKRGDVDLVSDPIEAITPTGIRAGGTEHPADVLVWGTGFRAAHFLLPMRVTGRDGVDLHAQWDGEPGAHLGITVPGFPNLFLLYGPNTNIVVNGSAVFFSECQVRHVLDCLRLSLTRGGAPIEPSESAYRAFRERVDAGNARRAWGTGGVRNWYQSASGRISQNWPGTVLEYWELTRNADPADYPVETDAAAVSAAQR